jgi:hypothetical protein
MSSFYFTPEEDEGRTRTRVAEAPPTEQPRGDGPRLVLVGGRFVVAPPEPQKTEEVELERALEMALQHIRDDFKTAGKFDGLEMILSLYMLHGGLDPNTPKMDLPFNAQQVPAAAQAVLLTLDRVPEAKLMRPRAQGLPEDIKEWDKLSSLSQPIGFAHEVIEANKSRILNQMSGKVEGSLKRVDSLLVDSPALRRGLKDALAVRKDPVEQAKKTRSDHKRVAADAVADAQANAEPAPAAPEVTQTTVTTTQPKNAPPVKPPTPKSKPKSKG